MRKGISWVLIVGGAFLLVAAGFLRFYAADELKRTPLSVDSVTRLDGIADKLNPGTGEVETLDVKVAVETKSDDEVSDEQVIAFVTSTCVVVDEGDVPDCVAEDDPQQRLVTASVDVFATDRETALSVNDTDYLPASAVPHEGLVNKWPFDAEKDTYPFWDGVLRQAVDAVYDGTETIDGLETYVYRVSVDREPAEVLSGVDGVYSLEKVINVDPVTGSIIRQQQVDTRTQANGDPLITLDVAYTDDTVSANVEDANDSGGRLNLITVVLPLVAALLGLVLLGLGVFLLLRARSGDHAYDDEAFDGEHARV